MKRFLLKPEGKEIEGALFSDGSLVIHGGIFHACQIASLDELARMFHDVDLEWLDDEIEWTQEQIGELVAVWNALMAEHRELKPAIITTVEAMAQLRKLGLLEEVKA